MGQSAGLILGAAGAVVGSFFGAPEIGFVVGSMLGAILFPPKPPTPANVRVQDSAYGKYIPRVYGLYRLAGNVIWAGQPHNHDPSGKGMGGKNQQPYTTISFAVGLCDGPISGVRRIWANGKLIYDISHPSNFQQLSGSAQMVTNFTVYLGDENQLPDPTMQSQLGAANVPAYRGLAYVVFNELSLQQWGNYMPSFTFEVMTYGTQTSSIGVVGSFSNFPFAAITSMPCITAQGGDVIGVDEYIYSQANAVGANISPYGSAQTAFFWRKGGGLTWQPYGNSDIPGIYLYPNWLRWDGTYDDMSLTPSMSLGPNSSGSNYWRNGQDFYITSTLGDQTVYRLQLPNAPTVNGSAVVSKGGALGASTTAAGGGIIVGGSSSYLYLLGSGSKLYRLDRVTLAIVNSWSSPVGGIGSVLDDDHIYVADGASGSIWLFRPSQNTWTNVGPLPFNNVTAMTALSSTLFVFGNAGPLVNNVEIGYTQLYQQASSVALSTIVADICTRAGLQPSQYDVSQLTDLVTGFAITDNSTSRSALAPLQAAYFFDVSDCDGLLRFVKRGGQPAVSIPWDDLGASSGAARDAASTNPIGEVLLQEYELPRSETITYVSQTQDYQSNTQREQRAVTSSNLDESTNVPIVMADAEAKTRVQTMLWERWTKRQQFTWSTDYKYLAVEPGDVVTLNHQNGETYAVRVTKVQLDGKGTLAFTGDLSVSAIYPNVAAQVSQGGAALGFPVQSLDYSGPTVLAVMDLPPLRSQDTSPGLYVAACGYASNWPGCYVDISRDDVNFSQAMSVVGRTPIGTCTTALGNFFGGNVPDELNSVSVALADTSLSLSSVSYTSFVNGANAALVGSELVYFRSATQTGPGQYTLTGLLRGLGGTEWAMGTHVATERFVLLQSSTVSSLGINLTDIGGTLYFETFLNNLLGQTPTGQTSVQPAVARVKPLSPWQLGAGHGSSVSASDIVVQWLRRARVNTQWLSNTDVPLDESVESYLVSVHAGSALKRQYVLSNAPTAAGWAGGGPSPAQTYPPFSSPSVPTFVYTAAMATNDGFSAGNSITFQVQQNSDQGVLGYAATTTITR
jgi:hypothetical protein